MNQQLSPEDLEKLTDYMTSGNAVDYLELIDMLNDWSHGSVSTWDIVHRILQKAEGLRATAANT